MEKKGKNGDSLSIDRIDNSKGYEFSNLQALTLAANTIKENQRRREGTDDSDLPF
jgi:hypothetical protein